MSTEATTTLDRARIAELTEREQRRLNERTTASRALYERARRLGIGGRSKMSKRELAQAIAREQ